MNADQYRGIFVRQAMLHPFRTFLVECDFDCSVWFYDINDGDLIPVDVDDRVFIHPESEKDEESVEVQGLVAWREVFMPVMEEASVGRELPFDWDSWNKRGKELAKKLKDVLPEGYYVYYTPPYEDPYSRDVPPTLIT